MVMKTKKAFSLIEMLIAMMIVLIAAMAAMPVITTQKPNIPPVNVRGQYACWRDSSGLLHYLLCDERACGSVQHATNECIFNMDGRPAHFFIAAVGSGSSTTPGQLVTADDPSLGSDLTIRIPNGAGPTTISSSTSSAEYSAASGHSVLANGINPSNIKKCSIVKNAPDQRCPFDNNLYLDGCALMSYNTAIASELKIEVICSDAYSVLDGIKNGAQSSSPNCPEAIEPGQNGDDDEMNLRYCPTERDSRPISVASITGGSYTANQTNTPIGNGTIVQTFKGIPLDSTQEVEFNLEFYDSSFTTKNNVVGETVANIQASNGEDYKSSFQKLLESINETRSSRLIKTLLDGNYGSINNNGAVLILW